MADLTITPAEVLEGSSAKTAEADCGEDIDQGEVVALVSGTLYLCDANHTNTSYNVAAGIALNAGKSGQPVRYVTKDTDFVIGTTNAPTPGKVYLTSKTAGGISPVDDLNTSGTNTQKVSVLGIGKASGKLHLDPINSGVAATS